MSMATRTSGYARTREVKRGMGDETTNTERKLELEKAAARSSKNNQIDIRINDWGANDT